MGKSIVIGLLFIGCINICLAKDKNDSLKVSFSLEEAKQYAIENNTAVKNASLDIKKARQKILETTAIGLPQISAKGSYSYMLTVPGQIESFSGFDALIYKINLMEYHLKKANSDYPGDPKDPGVFVPSNTNSDELRTTMTLDLTVSQLIFSGAYIVGLQASKTYKKLSELSYFKTKTDVIETITKTYFTALISKRNYEIADSSFKAMSRVLLETEAMFEQGLTEDTDVDQLRLTVLSIENNKRMLKRQSDLVHKLLKYQMGIPLENSIDVTDHLDSLANSINTEMYRTKSFELEQNVNYQVLNTKEKLMDLDVKRYKSEFLPTISAYYRHQENFNDKSFSFTPPDVIGINAEIPIFTSWSRMAKVSQAKIELAKAKNDKRNGTDGLTIEFNQAMIDLKTTNDAYKNQMQNIQLAKRIANKTLVKFRSGMASSIDVGQTQSQYLKAQGQYFQAVLNLVNAKAKLDKILTHN